MFPFFPKIPRLHKSVTITEKIDGTNGLVAVFGPDETTTDFDIERFRVLPDGTAIAAGSRKRWVNPEDDNHGFAAWVWDNAEDLAKLGPGMHHGEWWGHGIQRNYGRAGKFFSLFNTDKWMDESIRPNCCGVVPVIARGDGSKLNSLVEAACLDLRVLGSRAAPGFMNAEGVVVFHHAAGALFKITLDADMAKGLVPMADHAFDGEVIDLTPSLTQPTYFELKTVGVEPLVGVA